jgi:hypothetical protein
MLPAPAKIELSIGLTGAPPQRVTLDTSGLDAIDLVLMCGDLPIDGSGELERWLIDRWRAGASVAADIPTYYRTLPVGFAGRAVLVNPAAAPAAGAIALETLLPLLKALRRLITTARPLHALDYRLASEAHRADPANPKGYLLDAAGDPADLRERVRAASTKLQADILAPLEALLARTELKAAYEALLDDPSTFDASLWTPALGTLRSLLRNLALYGMAEALPASSAGGSAEIAQTLYAQGAAMAAAARKRLDTVAAILPVPAPPVPAGDPIQQARNRAGALDQRVAALNEAGRSLLGKSMSLAPLFQFQAEAAAEIAGRIATPIESDPIKIDTWLASLARVRKPLGNLNWIINLRSWIGGAESAMKPIQLPGRDGDPWVGAAWSKAPAAGDVLAVMAVDPPADVTAVQCGLVIDDWTEVVPTANETTGIAFHFDRPNAMPPQALLLAVSPNLDGHWEWDELVATIRDTMELARVRALEPEQIAATPYFHVLPAALLQFATGGGLSTLLSHNAVMRPTTIVSTP